MKKIYLFSALIVAIVGIALYFQVIKPQLNNRTVVAVVPETVTDEVLPLEFTYPSGEFGYALIEPPISSTTTGGLEKVYLIMDSANYIKYQQKNEESNTPPTVSVLVIKESVTSDEEADTGRITRLQNWAKQYPQYSSFGLVTSEPEVIELDGASAIRYQTGGKYKQDVYMASYRDRVYVFTGQYEDETDSMHLMFKDMMKTIIFN